MNQRAWAIAGGIGLIVLVGLGLYLAWPPTSAGQVDIEEALALSRIMLIGLGLVVALMAGLAIIYSPLNLTNQHQALGLPEGSIRALIAFSLVLAFVCLAAFLYDGISRAEYTPAGKPLTKITQAQLDDLRSKFVVVYEQARKSDGSIETDVDGRTPLYNAEYFNRHSNSSDDFAKQIFTTLATVFVSVISFYFGSAATSSGVSAGATAAGGAGSGATGPGGTRPGGAGSGATGPGGTGSGGTRPGATGSGATGSGATGSGATGPGATGPGGTGLGGTRPG